jgi:hypothetical protein
MTKSGKKNQKPRLTPMDMPKGNTPVVGRELQAEELKMVCGGLQDSSGGTCTAGDDADC